MVERVPDKNEVHGSIPCAPTKGLLTKFEYEDIIHITFEFGQKN